MASIFWTDEKIFNYIKARVEANLPINSLAVFNDNGYVYKIANKKFGSWNNTVKAAGFKPFSPKRKGKWTKEKIINMIQDYYELGMPLNAGFVAKKYQPLYLAARKKFKSWDKALIASGINPNTLDIKASKQLNLPLLED